MFIFNATVLSISIPFSLLFFWGCLRGPLVFSASRRPYAIKICLLCNRAANAVRNLADKDPAQVLNWGFIWRFELATSLCC